MGEHKTPTPRNGCAGDAVVAVEGLFLLLIFFIFKLRHRSFILLRRKAAFPVRLPISWNKIPMVMVNSPTLDTFKRLLDVA